VNQFFVVILFTLPQLEICRTRTCVGTSCSKKPDYLFWYSLTTFSWEKRAFKWVCYMHQIWTVCD